MKRDLFAYFSSPKKTSTTTSQPIKKLKSEEKHKTDAKKIVDLDEEIEEEEPLFSLKKNQPNHLTKKAPITSNFDEDDFIDQVIKPNTSTIISEKWYWKSDTDWVAFKPENTAIIERAYQRYKEDPNQETKIIPVDEERFIDLEMMLQKRFDDTTKIRLVKRGDGNGAAFSNSKPNTTSNTSNWQNKLSSATSKQTLSPSTKFSKSIVSTPSSPSPSSTSKSGKNGWYWRNDKGEWIEYDANLSSKLEEAFKKDRNTKVQVDKDRYVDLNVMIQCRYDDRNRARSVKRDFSGSSNTSATTIKTPTPTKSPYFGSKTTTTNINNKKSSTTTSLAVHNVTTSDGKAMWYWRSEGSWEAYSDETCVKIEEAYISGRKVVEIDPERYCDLKNMLQRRYDDLSKHRYILRKGPNPTGKQSQLTPEQQERIEKNKQEALKKLKANLSKKNNNTATTTTTTTFATKPKMNLKNSLILEEDEDLMTDPEENQLLKFISNSKKGVTSVEDISSWADFDEKMRFSKMFFLISDPFNKKVALWKGDITSLKINAIVNAAKPSLLGGGGIDGAIHSAAGRGLLEECMKLDGCDVGDAKITGGHKLPAKHIIHTVGPIGEKQKKLVSCYKRCLEVLVENNLKTIAFCGISTGIYGYPKEPAANVALNTVREWLSEDDNITKVDKIVFCMFTDEEYDVYKKFFPMYFPRSKDTYIDVDSD